jgi:uncharacterized protein (TIGR01244 family)
MKLMIALCAMAGQAAAEGSDRMSNDFIPLAQNFWVSPQIAAADLESAKASGVTLIINNRPDGEEPGQPRGAEIEAAAKALGLSYVAIPVGPMGVSAEHLDAFDKAVAANKGGVLAYCRSGTRSTIVRALSEARKGRAPDDIISEAAEAGYNIAGQRRAMEAMGR